MKRAYAEIDLARLIANFKGFRNNLDSGTEVLGVVKADAYGHGAIQVAKALQAEGVSFFGVAWLSEAEELRKSGINSAILVLSEPSAEYVNKIVELDLVQTIYTLEFAQQLNAESFKQQCKTKVHVKIDTGMGRIGIAPEEVIIFLDKITKLPGLELAGVLSHFACADEPGSDLNKQQIATISEVFNLIKSKYPQIKYFHAANSAATTNFSQAQFNLVRLGIGLYKGVMTFKTRVMFVKTVPAGTSVSYGATFVTKRETKLATISAGYADGLPRLLSNKGKVLINGQKLSIVGRVCMDMSIVDVTGHNVKVGDEVVLIGKQGNNEITAQDVADCADTIDYEIVCGINKRVPRIYQ